MLTGAAMSRQDAGVTKKERAEQWAHLLNGHRWAWERQRLK